MEKGVATGSRTAVNAIWNWLRNATGQPELFSQHMLAWRRRRFSTSFGSSEMITEHSSQTLSKNWLEWTKDWMRQRRDLMKLWIPRSQKSIGRETNTIPCAISCKDAGLLPWRRSAVPECCGGVERHGFTRASGFCGEERRSYRGGDPDLDDAGSSTRSKKNTVFNIRKNFKNSEDYPLLRNHDDFQLTPEV